MFDPIEQLSSCSEVHDEVESCGGLKSPIEFDNERVISHAHDPSLIINLF